MEGGGADPADGTAAASSAAEPRNVNEEVVRRYCEQYNDEMKGQAGRDLLFDFKKVTSTGWDRAEHTAPPITRVTSSQGNKAR